MKYYLLIILVLAGISCDSSETTDPISTGITVTSAEGFIVGGGRWFEGADTATYYDAYPSFTLKNTSGGWQDVTYTYTFGLLDGKEIITNDPKLISRTGHFSNTISVPPLSTIVIHDTLLIDLGRRQNDWTLPYGYALALNTTDGPKTIVTRLTGSSPFNRFQGVVYTTALGSDSLGMLDEPDDGDYRAAIDSHIVTYPIFPNPSPASSYPIFQFQLNRPARVSLSIRKTPRSVISYIIDNELLDAGMLETSSQASALDNGQYRLYLVTTVPGKAQHVSYGDFIVLK